MIIAVGISMLQRCGAGAGGFEGFRERTGARSLSRDGFRGWQNFTKKSAAKFGGGNVRSVNLLANDAGIILRQIEASLMLLL
jgi:hypothetical protein